jgi:hypothetical protein
LIFSPNIIITVLVFLQFLLQIFPKLRYKFAKFQIDSFRRTDKTRPVWFCWFSQKKPISYGFLNPCWQQDKIFIWRYFHGIGVI